VRSLIYEYMGVFQDKLIEEAVSIRVESLNPHSLSFSDGSPFLTDDEVTTALQFRRDFERAQRDYEDYIYGNEFIRSSGVDFKNILANYQEFEAFSLSHMSEVGVVEELRKVNGDEKEVKEKADILNTEVAEFGEEFRHETLGDENYLARVCKLGHLMPLDRVAHLE
jgi:hypothetical protein